MWKACGRGRGRSRTSGNICCRPPEADTCLDFIREVMGRYVIPNWEGGNRQLEHMSGLGRGIATAQLIHLLRERGTAGESPALRRARFVVKR